MRHGQYGGQNRLMRLAVVAVVLLVASCSEIIRNHGYIPLEEDLQTLNVGTDTRSSVEERIGKPSASGVLQDADWYYVGSKVRHFGWKKPEEIDREVVALSFQGETLANIERFGLEDGRVVTLSRRVTETTVRDVTFIRQIIRNFGRINVSEALGG